MWMVSFRHAEAALSRWSKSGLLKLATLDWEERVSERQTWSRFSNYSVLLLRSVHWRVNYGCFLRVMQTPISKRKPLTR